MESNSLPAAPTHALPNPPVSDDGTLPIGLLTYMTRARYACLITHLSLLASIQQRLSHVPQDVHCLSCSPCSMHTSPALVHLSPAEGVPFASRPTDASSHGTLCDGGPVPGRRIGAGTSATRDAGSVGCFCKSQEAPQVRGGQAKAGNLLAAALIALAALLPA